VRGRGATRRYERIIASWGRRAENRNPLEGRIKKKEKDLQDKEAG